MAHPKLFVFTISHFCEKARWALDSLGVEYELVTLSQLSHTNNAKRLGLKRGSLPILEVNGQAIQGSDQIIDWADPQNKLHSDDSEVNDLEHRLDKTLGVHIRRWYYSEALIDHSDTVRKTFAHALPLRERFMLRFAWPKIRSAMIKLMDLGEEQEAESREIVRTELDWLDSLIDTNEGYLSDVGFSRADITAASLLAPLVSPAQHPVASKISVPPRVQATLDEWSQRPSLEWIKRVYAAHR